LSSFFAAFPI